MTSTIIFLFSIIIIKKKNLIKMFTYDYKLENLKSVINLILMINYLILIHKNFKLNL